MATFTVYVKRKSGDKAIADKAILLLQAYFNDVVKKSKDFADAKAVLLMTALRPLSLIKT